MRKKYEEVKAEDRLETKRDMFRECGSRYGRTRDRQIRHL